MIIQSSKKMTKCSKDELILLLRGEIENRSKLIKLLEEEWDKHNEDIEDERYPNYQSPERQSFLSGMETTINSVRNFYEIK
nr:MAG TPA: hypothetical protein [Caudoviricetes sp.]